MLTIWLAVIALGLGLLLAYSFTPGTLAQAPPRWPASSRLARVGDRPTLVMVAHPHCSCTRASIAELARLMTRLSGQLSGYVVFIKPDGMDRDWERTDLRSSAARIDGIQVIDDPGGAEARRFGAVTSGQVYLYDKGGELLFRGGITPTRSHEGDSVGRRRIVDLVTMGVTDRALSAVFGCSLQKEPTRGSWLPEWAGALAQE